MKFLLCFVLTLCLPPFAFGQETFRVFDAKGRPSTLEQVLKAVGDSDAVFLGEQHDDSVGHAVQLEIFKRAVTQFAAKRKVALSLEMFERDVQIILDEYLKGLISEQHFLLSSRPWKNYAADYKPLVELAKEKKLHVIAANAPRRYINMVSRTGRDSLKGLSKDAKKWLAPLPYAEPSETYAKKFKALMASAPEAQMGIDKILASQALWDATMSHAVAGYLKKNKKSLVIHLNGSFHTENRLGTVEHLLKYRSKAKVLVVTIRREDDFKTFVPSKHTDLGDFVILTTSRSKVSFILERMETHHKALRSLTASLTMLRHNVQLKTTDTLTGHASYLPRGANQMYLRVDWIKPVVEQLFVIGDQFELYRPRLNQVIGGRVQTNKGDNSMGRALSFLSKTRAQIKADYSVSLVGEEQINGLDTWRLAVTPKTAAMYKTSEIWVDHDGMPRRIKVIAQNGDTTTILLSNIAKNVTLNTEVFRPSYPSSVVRIRA
jgi:uncharacterized iron-regulated protein/outer membrane lipoprotein-sorting protein